MHIPVHMLRSHGGGSPGLGPMGTHLMDRDAAVLASLQSVDTGPAPIEPVDTSERSANPLRPVCFAEMVGQERIKPLLQRVVQVARDTGRPLDHTLLTGPSGTGKSTVSHVIAAELGRRVFQIDAPVSQERLLELREVMQDGDVLFVDEIHQQVVSDRRGSGKAAQAETFYHLMEDRVIPTDRGLLPFPHITVIGATTDAGLLPEAFLGRFPLQPRLDRYSVTDMTELARRNATALGMQIEANAAVILARASRRNPRQMNQYVRNADTLGETSIDESLAMEIVVDLNSTTLDGLTVDMAGMLKFLLVQGRRVVGGEVRYEASVNTIATALGKSRDTKAVSLFVEPYLIEEGYVQVGPRGRLLTNQGIQRALHLIDR